VILFYIFLLVLFGDDVSLRELTIFDNGQSNYVIVVPALATKIEQKAAFKLQYYLREMSGIKLKIVPENKSDNTHNIYIGNCNNTKKLKIDFLALGKDGISLNTLGNDLFIYGGNGKGVLFGVYSFLEHIGCRKYSSYIDVIPINNHLKIPGFNITEIPVFNYRETLMPDASNFDYAEWHKLHHRSERGNDWGMWVHTFDDFIHPERYFDAHPEYFLLNNGFGGPNTII
jgi:hypothetical protein